MFNDFHDLYDHDTLQKEKKTPAFLDSAGMCFFFPLLKLNHVRSVSISSDSHINSLQGDVGCCKHWPLQDQWHHFFSLSIPSLRLDPKPLVLIITSLKPHSGDEQPLQTVNKQVSFFHEASSQKLIAPQKCSLPTVNSNYSPHGFLSLSNIFQELLPHKSFISGLFECFITHLG